MKITQEFVDLMICPACRGRLKLKADGAGIKCEECRRVYPIEDDIPAMLIDKAVIEDEELAAPRAD